MGSETARNVVGIPPENRDAAGIAARTESISAGEWMAQQIPANISDSGSSAQLEDFDQLRTRLVEVLDRLRHVEERAYTDASRGTVQQLHQDVSRLAEDLVRATGHSATQISVLSANLQSLTGSLEEVRAESSKSIRQCLTLLRQGMGAMNVRHADTSASMAGDLAAVVAKLDEVSARASDSFAALDRRLALAPQNLERLDHRYGQTAQTLSSGLSAVNGRLDEVFGEAAQASAALELRLAQIAAQSVERHSASEERQEALGRRLDEARSEASQAAETLEARLAVLGQTLAHLDQRHDEAGQITAGELVALGGKLEAVRSETAQSCAKLEQGLAQIDGRTDDQHAALSEQHETLSGRLDAIYAEASRAAGIIEARLGAVDRRLEHLDHCQDETAHTLASDLSVLTSKLDEARGETSKAPADWELQLARAAARSDDRHSALKEEHEALSERLDDVRSQASQSPQATAALETRLAAVDQTLEHLAHRQDETAKTVAGSLAALDEKFDGVRSGSAETSAELEQRLARMQSQLDELHARHGEVSQNLSAAEEREGRMAALVSRLELSLATLESHVLDPAAEERTATLERKMSELASQTEAAKHTPPAMPSAASPGGDRTMTPHPDIEDIEQTAQYEAVASAGLSNDLTHRDIAQRDSDHNIGDEEAAAPVESSAHEVSLPPGPASEPPPVVGPDQDPETSAGIAGEPAADLPPFPPFAGTEPEDVPPIVVGDANAAAVPDPVPTSATDYLAAARRSAQAAEDHANGSRADSLGYSLFAAQMFATRKGRMVGTGILAAVVLLGVATLGFSGFLRGSTTAGNRAMTPSSSQKLAQGTRHGLQPAARPVAPVHAAPPGSKGTPRMARDDGALHAKPAGLPGNDPHATTISADLTRIQSLANSGDPRAQLIMGLYDLRGEGDHMKTAQAAKWLELAAAQGEPVAQYRLGTLYAKGVGVPADATKAFHWYEAAAKSGNRKAMQNLALDCVQGVGTARNLPQAVRWFTHAADLGLVDAQFNLAVLHEQGLGVSLSLRDAYQWFGIAAKYGDQESKGRVDVLSGQIPVGDRAAAEKAITDFKPAPMDTHANVIPELPPTG